jgi:hypothetical protein
MGVLHVYICLHICLFVLKATLSLKKAIKQSMCDLKDMPHALNFLQAFAITNDSLEMPIFSCRELVTDLQQNFSVNWHQFFTRFRGKTCIDISPCKET